jgi:hypothetical protein
MVQALLALGQEAGLELSYDAESFALLVAPQGQLLLDNVFAAFQNAPDEQRRGILDGALGMVSEFANAMPQSWATAQRRIVPRVRSRSYYELFQLQMAATGLEGGNSTPPWVALGEWLAVALCIDLPHSLRDVHPEHLQEWGVDFGQAMEQALRNLRGFRQAPLVPLGDGCFRGSWGDHMDASRLLLPDLIQALCGEEHPIIAVPSRDTMLLAGAASLVQLRHQVVENFSQADHTLSPVPLRWNGGSWEDFLTPEMSQLAKFATAAEYGHQAKLLTALFKHTGNSLFPATVQIYTVPETDETATLCIWNEGVESLLPRTDVLALMARESQQPTFVLWEQALVSLADVLVAQEGRPVLYRTGAFPGPERLSSVPQVDPRNPFQPRVAARVADMVLPLQVHLCSQQSSEAWTARLEEVNVLFAPAGIRFDPEIESLEVPEGAWLNAMSEEAHCAGLLNLPEVRPGVLQIFCLSQIPEAGYLFRESLVILAGDRVSPAVLASHLGCALGLSERPTFRRAERRVLRFRAQRLLAICASQRLDVTVHRMSSISQAQVVEALEFAGVHLEKLGISLLIRAVLSERIAAETLGQPEQLCQLDTFVENSVNLFLIEEIAGAPPIQVHPELPLVLVTPPAESPLHEVLTEALLLPLRTQRDQLLQAPTLHIPLQVQLVVHPQLGASATVSEVEQLLDETNEIWAPTGVRFEAEISSLEVADAPLQAVLPNAPELGSVSRRADCLPLLELDGVRPGVLQLFVLSHLPHLGGEAPSNSAGYFFHSGVMLLPSDLGQSVAVFQRLLGRCLGLGPRPGDEQSIMGKGRSFLLEELLLLRHTTQRQVLREFSPCLPVFVHQAYNEEFGTALGEASRQAEILLAFEAAALTLSSAGVMLWLRGVLNTTVSNQTLANPAALAKNRHRDAGSINVFVVRQLPAQLSGPWLTLVPQRLILVRREGRYPWTRRWWARWPKCSR